MSGYRIRLLGKPAILDEADIAQPVRGHQAWALLSRIALSDRPLDRRKLADELFAETTDPLGSLRWCLASLRKALDSSDFLVGDPVQLHLPPGVTMDVHDLFADALPISEMASLLDGIAPQCGPEFATWLLVERTRIDALIEGRLREHTMKSLAIGDYDLAIAAARVSIQRDAFDEAAHILLVRGLALSGNGGAALSHVEATERLFDKELGVSPSQALRSAARASIAGPPAGIPPAAHTRSLIASGKAALAAGAADAGVELLRQAVERTERTTDPRSRAEALLELGKGLVHAVRGYDDEGSVLLREVTEVASQRGYGDLAAEGLVELGYVEALAGRRPAAERYLNSALEFAQSPAEFAAIHSVAGFNLVDWGKLQPGIDHYQSALEHARRAADRRREVWTLGLGARGQVAADDLDCAAAWLRDCLAIVDDLGWIAFRPWPVSVLAEVDLLRRAPPAKVRASLEDAFALSCHLRDPCWEAASCRSLALAFVADGDDAAAATWLDDAYHRCIRETDPYAALKVQILADSVVVNQRLGREEASGGLAREWLAAAAHAYMDHHVERAAATISKER